MGTLDVLSSTRNRCSGPALAGTGRWTARSRSILPHVERELKDSSANPGDGLPRRTHSSKVQLLGCRSGCLKVVHVEDDVHQILISSSSDLLDSVAKHSTIGSDMRTRLTWRISAAVAVKAATKGFCSFFGYAPLYGGRTANGARRSRVEDGLKAPSQTCSIDCKSLPSAGPALLRACHQASLLPA